MFHSPAASKLPTTTGRSRSRVLEGESPSWEAIDRVALHVMRRQQRLDSGCGRRRSLQLANERENPGTLSCAGISFRIGLFVAHFGDGADGMMYLFRWICCI